MPSPVPADVVTALQGVPTAVLADTDRVVMALGTPVAPMGKLSCFVGEALTIQAGSLAQWKALELAQAGHVLIIACQGRRDRAEFGAIYAQIAVRTGIAAIVTDGLIRDRDEIAGLGLPVFACGTHPASPADPTPGRIGLPLELHGATIACGDVIAGDDDGLVVIPRAALSLVRDKLAAQRAREEELRQSLSSSRESNLPERIRAALAKMALTRSSRSF